MAVPQNPSDSSPGPLQELLACASTGDKEAQYLVGFFYRNGFNCERNYEEAHKWFLASAKQGYAKAQDAVSELYLNFNAVPRDETEAFKWSLRAAEQNDPSGMFDVGMSYRIGRGVPKDLVHSYAWFKQAELNGHKHGKMHSAKVKKEMTKQEYAEALKVIRTAQSKRVEGCASK